MKWFRFADRVASRKMSIQSELFFVELKINYKNKCLRFS